ncbi:unnamed protein product [Onchocerca ochengi]|uniref:BED-type domain-containing protein n=1 Tax=Onchocerca ochengi TaxID=42157 RepID=A0A182DX49_ONCOC|nr:unnamed protein product [Onchocerca ochengi]
MSTSSVISVNSAKSTGCHKIVISPPIVPSQYNAKNAGRKKTNPVWNFFVDLKTKGLSGVRCRYCEWITNDRSPTTLKFHLKRKHDTGIGGIWNIVEERIGINQPQGRSRLVVNNRNGETAAFVIPVDTEVRPESDREQQCYPGSREVGIPYLVDYTCLLFAFLAIPSPSSLIPKQPTLDKLRCLLSGIFSAITNTTSLAMGDKDYIPDSGIVEDSKGAYLANSESPKNDRKNWSRIRDPLWVSNEEIVRRSDIVLKREWFKVECYDNEKEMFREQLRGQAGARVVVDTKPSSSQQALLDQFIQNATKNAKLNGTLTGITASTSAYTRPPSLQPQTSSNIGCGQDNIFDTKGLVDDNLISARSAKIFSPKVECGEGDDAGDNNEPLYVLSDGSNLSELLHVANDMDLAFTYNSRRTGEFCFESNAQDMRGRLVVFADLGTKVAVRERFNGSDLSYEEWNKADWKQFLWAVRGKCMNVLRGL